MNNEKMFKEYIAAISELHSKQISKTTARIYWETLADYSDEQCNRAFDLAIRTLKFFPKPAELIELIPGEVVSIEDRALAVANSIVSHLNQWGASKHPDLKGDSIAMELLDRRWPYKRWAATVLESELKWWVKDFSEAYRAYSESGAQPLIDGPEELKKIAKCSE